MKFANAVSKFRIASRIFPEGTAVRACGIDNRPSEVVQNTVDFGNSESRRKGGENVIYDDQSFLAQCD
jgi:hypothetical protein